ncbi:hypothetical protein H2248_001704 [Termitomyces sp. 'cryptogamus']|nr:hypothetical protein H2248_001704 [Termitomyces sp. 'cryptogamus']
MTSSAQQEQPSWQTVHASPPQVKSPYTPSEALGDLPGVCYALETFLNSRMLESEEYCHKSDVGKERLYFATGYGLIQCVKGLMSYADEDLLSAINHTKHGNHIASQHRKKAGFFGSLMGSTASIRSMSDGERHAELTYAESLFEKALLGIVYSGDWLAFIKEALNMRTVFGVYRHLGAFLDEADAAYAASLLSSSSSSTASSTPSTPTTTTSRSSLSLSTPPTSVPPSPSTLTSIPTPTPTPTPKKPEDPTIDAHFRSGVYLGVGMCNIILSLIPGKLATLVELFGYKGDRTYGLDLLMRAGGWSTDRSESAAEPGVSTTHEGVRRPICDMALLIFHLVMSSYTGAGVDIVVATRILEWNLKRFPNGVFFLFGAGRLALHRSRPRLAIHYYSQAMASQIQYRNLDHISYWECAIARLALWEVGEAVLAEDKDGGEDEGQEIRVGGSAACWRVLEAEATWSKAIYSYGLAACFLEDWDTDSPPSTPSGTGPTPKPKTKEARMKEASNLMKRVPNIRQKIAGKSIPLEKFVARKARKYTSQANRLLLPALEIAYIFYAIAHAPRSVLSAKMLPLVRGALQKLSLYGPGTGCAQQEEPKTPLGKGKEKGGKSGPEGYEGGKGEYWDDLCLARFLEGVCLRFIAYPDPDATPDPSSETDIIPSTEAAQGAVEAFKAVFEYGPKIELDHYIVYHAHYEYGRLLACQGDFVGAKREFELVLSGKPLEVGASGRKVQSHSLLYPFLFLFRLC